MNSQIVESLYRCVELSIMRLSNYSKIKPTKALEQASSSDLEEKRIDLIVAGFKRSITRFKSAINMWQKFCDKFGFPVFPVQSDRVEIFISNFRVSVTARNYIASIKNACLILRQSTKWDGAHVRKLIDNVEKLAPNHSIEIKSAIQIVMLRKLVNRAISLSKTLKVWSQIRVILVLGYSMLLRIPSECIPMQNCKTTTSSLNSHSAVKLTKSNISLTLKRRKNLNKPSEIKRECICTPGDEDSICPVHTLKEFINTSKCPEGGQLFDINAEEFNYRLRLLLQLEGETEEQAMTYSSKSLRRGGARDVVELGLPADTLKVAGMWQSSEYMAYLDRSEVAKSTMTKVMKSKSV